MVKGAAAGTVLGHAFDRAVGWLKEYGAEIVKYAARTQTLGVVTNQLAKGNDYTLPPGTDWWTASSNLACPPRKPTVLSSE